MPNVEIDLEQQSFVSPARYAYTGMFLGGGARGRQIGMVFYESHSHHGAFMWIPSVVTVLK